MSNSDTNLKRPSFKDCLNVANSLVARCNLSVPQVNHVSEINSKLIVLLYEKITGSTLSVSCGESEVEDVLAVINALSLDVLHLSLSHINAESVVTGDVVAVHNILHVLEGILLHSSSSKEQQTFPRQKINETDRKICSKESICKQASTQLGAGKIFETNVALKLERTLIQNSHLLKLESDERRSPQHFSKPFKKSMCPRTCNKSFLLPRKRRSGHSQLKNISSQIPELPQSEEKSYKENLPVSASSQTSFIQELLEEFPCIHISKSLMKNIGRKYALQLIRLHKIMKNCLLKRSCPEAENILKRQLKLAGIIKDDIHQQQYLKKVKEEKENERKIKYSLRDSRLRSAKMKQYSDDFIKDMRKKLMTNNTREELIFKDVFREVMDIQSEHVDYLCQQVRETKMKDDENYLNYLYSLENLYQSQYLALSEEIANEKSDVQLRLNAERQAVARTERRFRETLKSEIRSMQKIIVEQDVHFREMDAALLIDRKRKPTHSSH